MVSGSRVRRLLTRLDEHVDVSQSRSPCNYGHNDSVFDSDYDGSRTSDEELFHTAGSAILLLDAITPNYIYFCR